MMKTITESSTAMVSDKYGAILNVPDAIQLILRMFKIVFEYLDIKGGHREYI